MVLRIPFLLYLIHQQVLSLDRRPLSCLPATPALTLTSSLCFQAGPPWASSHLGLGQEVLGYVDLWAPRQRPSRLRVMVSVYLSAESSPYSLLHVLETKALPEGYPSSIPELPEAPAWGKMKRY